MKKRALVLCGWIVFFSDSRSAEDSGSLRIQAESGREGVRLTVQAPDGFTNRVEIYSSDCLFSNDWNLAVQNLRPGEASPEVWAPAEKPAQFFLAGNMDIDSDEDGLPDAREIMVHRTDPDKWDTGENWIPDGWAVQHGLNPLAINGSSDADADGLNLQKEFCHGTDPNDPDTDADGIPDGWEVDHGLNPLVPDGLEDPDDDGLDNYREFIAGTHPYIPDSDDDGIPDGFEVSHGMNPLNSQDAFDDPDGDLIPSFYEYILPGGDPFNPLIRPAASAVVSQSGAAGTFSNLSSAILSADGQDWPVIFIEPGIYSIPDEEGVTLTNAEIVIYADPGTVVLDGGGSNRIFTLVSGNPFLAGLEFRNGYSAFDGGAIYVQSAKPVITRCVFEKNRSERAGGAVYTAGSTLRTENCVFIGNSSGSGGAVHCVDSGPELNHCTWVGNHASVRGGAVHRGTVVNGIVWGNCADAEESQLCGSKASFSCIQGGYPGSSNISADPGLVQMWRLSGAGSSCIDSAAAGLSRFDLDGEPRNSSPDRGADEWVDLDADGFPDRWENQWFGCLTAVTDGNLPAGDSDGRLSLTRKYQMGLNPLLADSDSDGLSDYAELFIYKTDPLHPDLPGSAPSDYRIEPVAYDWIDISETGVKIENFTHGIDGYAQVEIGFPFTFYGQSYPSAYVCNNGFISFGAFSTSYENQSLPSSRIPERSLCVFWDDLAMMVNLFAAVYVESSPERCVISFEEIPLYGSPANQVSFQAVLYHDGAIVYQYKEVSDDGSPPTIGAQWGEGSVEFYAGGMTGGTALRLSGDAGPDSDADGVSDTWEMRWYGSLDAVTNGADFAQGERFTYTEAAYLGLNPHLEDTDGDGLSDTYEVEHGLNPLVQEDTDGDGMPDYLEVLHGLDPDDPADALNDPDGDGFPNLYECRHGSDPRDADSVPLPNRYVSLDGQHIAPFTDRDSASVDMQSALIVAEPYDIIQVADGIYTGPQNREITFLNKPLMLLSENGPEQCILDCEMQGRGFYLAGRVVSGSVIRGFQVLNGYSGYGYTYDAGRGGAAYCSETEALFDNCLFRQNASSNRGGAMYAIDSAVRMKNTVFERNGGIYLWGGACCFEESVVELSGCAVTESIGYSGSAVFSGTEFVIQDSLFSENTCCALELYGSGRVVNTVFSANQDSQWNPGAVYMSYSNVDFFNCVFLNNAGQGAVQRSSGSALFQNCTLLNNQGPAIRGTSETTALRIRNSILWRNEGSSYQTEISPDIQFSCLSENIGTNNIHIDPMLTELGELLPVSPCIDPAAFPHFVRDTG